MAKQTIAQMMVSTLKQVGVERIYGLAGDSLNGITDAVRQVEGMAWVHVRHEEVAAFAAGAEAHLTGALAVCAGSCGPGNLHLINGLYDCHRSRVPVLAIAAQIPSGEIGSNYFQETHPEHLFKECSHYCEVVQCVEQMPRALEIAIHTALGMRGVAVLVIPGDVAMLDAAYPQRVICLPERAALVPAEARAAEALNAGEAVTILAGAGCAGSHAELIAVAEKLKAPVVHALRGKEFIEYDNPFDVGMSGLIGTAAGYQAMMRCDTLLMLGTDFPYQQFYPEKAKIIQVDRRQEQLARRTRVDIGIVGDVKATLDALMPRLAAKTERKHLDRALEDYKKTREDLYDNATGKTGETPIHPQYVAKLIDELAAEDAIFTCDVGTPTIWAARYFTMNGKRRLIGSFNHGTMASAMPQAIGAQLAQPGRQVIALCGDGGIAMLMGDLLTLHQEKAAVKLIVLNNSALSFVELEMKTVGLMPHATELKNPDFAQIAEASHVMGITVDRPEDLRGALVRAFEHEGPALVDVRVNRQELSLPPSIELKQVLGFNMYLLKAVFSGRADEVIDLAKTNLLR